MPPRHVSPADLESFKLGVDSEEIALDSSELVCATNLALVSQATRYIDIVGRELDRTLYDRSDFLEAMQRVVLGSARARVRVLVQSIDRAVSYGHRLLEVARRTPTYIDIRLQSNECAQHNAAFLISDRVGYVYREAADRFDAIASFNDSRRAALYLHEFDLMWQSARDHPDTRRVHL